MISESSTAFVYFFLLIQISQTPEKQGSSRSSRLLSSSNSSSMSSVIISDVVVLDDNPASFLSPFRFEISYECLVPLKEELEWKLIYVGCAMDENYDQLLDNVIVGPVDVGCYQFILQANPPDPSRMRQKDILGVAALLLTCSYLGQEFVRVGYYVNNDYEDEQLKADPPQVVLIDRVQRDILSDNPTVTTFPVNLLPENPVEIDEDDMGTTNSSEENDCCNDIQNLENPSNQS